MPQEDVETPNLPNMVALLHDLQLGLYSLDWNRDIGILHCTPNPPEDMVKSIRYWYDELKFLQPGVCDSCQQWNIRRLDAYWGASPLYCPRCLNRLLQYFDKTDTWPTVQFPELEESDEA